MAVMKTRSLCYTSHWDLDYMPREELEAVLSDEAEKPANEKS
jgi:hypothetical protein